MRTLPQPAPGRPKAAEHPLGGWHRYSGAGCLQISAPGRPKAAEHPLGGWHRYSGAGCLQISAPGRPKAAEHPLGGWHRYSGAGCAQFIPARRGVLAGLGSLALAPASWASPDSPTLDHEQSRRVRDWMTLLIHAQVERGPTPRWTHRDCAGLVRFAVAEALRPHDLAWRRANGLLGTRVPPDVQEPGTAAIRHAWRRADGSRHAFVGALELVQENTRFVSRQLAQAVPGDLLFYDFGDDQHLMVWMGRYVAYHTGHTDATDNGLRALRPAQLLGWRDTRWRPEAGNPNFSGLYRLAFLTP